MSDYTTYSEAIEQAMRTFNDAVVRTGGYDENILDHYNEAREDETPVYVEAQEVSEEVDDEMQYAPAIVLRWVRSDGYIDTGEKAATILDSDDYERLGYDA